jgi:hypothetical protein
MNHQKLDGISERTDLTGWCYYCGWPADSVDHVIPLSFRNSLVSLEPDFRKDLLRRRTLTVQCCRECNSLLGATYQETLEERKHFLKGRIRCHYRKALKVADFTEKELEQFGPTLRREVESAIVLKDAIKARLAW